MTNVLLSWVGSADLRAALDERVAGGPILAALRARSFDHIVLLNDHGAKKIEPYLAWLRSPPQSVSVPVTVLDEPLPSPMAFGEIYRAAARACAASRERFGPDTALTFHLSPGTPAMAAVWILLGKTRFPSTLLQGSPRGIEEADVPFAIEAELVDPALASGELHASSSSVFDSIIHESRAMRDVVALAARAAPLDVPVLIEGESGTGKELLARALHSASRRAKAPFIGINCGALPSGTVESELFGHERGAFTGAVRQRKGYFEEASGGTLFLDEVSELPLHVQVKLLRVLQEGEVTRLGLSRSLKVDVRIVAATNQSLIAGVQAGSFRQDLLYRLAWVVLNVPPLRDRGSDVDLLIKHALVRINEKAGPTTFQRKILSAGGRKRLNEHPWPGNVRELVNTLWRAVFWSSGSMITEKDVDAAFLRGVEVPGDGVLNRPIGSGLDLKAILKDVESHYMKRAMDAAPGNKAEAARLLGIKERKTFAYRAKKYGL